MPIYEYECSKCEHQEEHLVSSTHGREIFYCPNCAKNNKAVRLNKLISVSNFRLKGGGWAEDGYSNKQAKPAGA